MCELSLVLIRAVVNTLDSNLPTPNPRLNDKYIPNEAMLIKNGCGMGLRVKVTILYLALKK